MQNKILNSWTLKAEIKETVPPPRLQDSGEFQAGILRLVRG
jgi:hypothetical protein